MEQTDLLKEMQAGIAQFKESVSGLRDDLKAYSRTNIKTIDSFNKGIESLDDIQKAREQQLEAINELNKNKAESDESDREEEKEQRDIENNKLLKETTDVTKKSVEIQQTTAAYLATLNRLTEENAKESEKRYQGQKADNESIAGAISRNVFNAVDSFGAKLARSSYAAGGDVGGVFAGTGSIISGISEMGRGLGNIGRKTKELSTGGTASYFRQRNMKKQQQQLDADKAMYSAQKSKLEDLKASGASKSEIKEQLRTILESKSKVRETAGSLGDLFSKESIYQKGLQNKSFRSMSADDKELLANQTSKNFYESATDDLKMRSGKSNAAGEVGGSTEMGLSNKSSKDVLSTVMPKVTRPITLGDHIVASYNELTKIRSLTTKMANADRKMSSDSSSGDGGGGFGFGGFLSNFIRGPMIRTLFTRVLPIAAAVGGGLWLTNKIQSSVGNAFGVQGKAGIQEGEGVAGLADDVAVKGARYGMNAAGRVILKEGTEAGPKTVAKTGLKAGLKTAGKTATKALAKKIPFVGAGVGLALAADRFSDGDYIGGALEAASGIASIVPVLGTGVSLAIDGVLAVKDVVSEMGPSFKEMGSAIGGVTKKVGEFALKSAKGLGTAFITGHKKINEFVVSGAKKAFDGVKSIGSSVVDLGKRVGGSLKSAIVTMGGSLKGPTGKDRSIFSSVDGGLKSLLMSPLRMLGLADKEDDASGDVVDRVKSRQRQEAIMESASIANDSDEVSMFRKMQLQARLFASEMLSMQKSDEYVGMQANYARAVGASSASALNGAV